MDDSRVKKRESKGFVSGTIDTLAKQNASEASNLLRGTNFINAILVIFAGIYTALDIGSLLTLNFSFIAISCYIVFFGCLLCCFECRLSRVEDSVREYFGFMYSYVGRAIFLLFIAFFCFGLKERNSVGIIIGIVTLLNAMLNFFVMYYHGQTFSDPTSNYQTGEDLGQQYVESNPELAKRAIDQGVNFAIQNPNVVRQGSNYVSEYAKENPKKTNDAFNTVNIA
eukprot:maker-scaffold_9-snap-gene-10.8-mRNA-1 protein AED:0.00 eAED:0.00 QI:112/1/1/1/1/1/3/691/224